MEKSKQKEKHKKSKHEKQNKTNDFEEFLEDDIPELPTVSSFIHNIPTNECAVASNLAAISLKDDKITTKEVMNDSIIEEQVLIMEDSRNDETTTVDEINYHPTAPLCETNKVVEKGLIAMYPDLSQMENIENKTTVPVTLTTASISNTCNIEHTHNLKPFTEMELDDLYKNPQIKLAEHFECEFLQAELDGNRGSIENNILYEYLAKYAQSCAAVKSMAIDIEYIKKEIQDQETKLWGKSRRTTQNSVSCRVCSKSHTAKRTFDEYTMSTQKFDEVNVKSKEYVRKCCQLYIRYIYNMDVYKNLVSQKLDEIINSCPKFENIYSQTPIALRDDTDMQISPDDIAELRRAVGILFLFLRRPVHEKLFMDNIKVWIKQLVAVQLRVATWHDHMFLLYHVLRCPNGTSMSWAASLIQIPNLVSKNENIKNTPVTNNPFIDIRINHCMTVLATLLLPIKRRAEFLLQIIEDNNLANVIDLVQEERWTILDSDGEENETGGECSGPKESDLISLLNQIPLEDLLSTITLVAMKDNQQYEYDTTALTGHYILKFVAFSTNLVKILGDGLMTYDTEKYRQFAKRLARLIRHVVLYTKDMNEIFQKTYKDFDMYMKNRVQLEYSIFIVRTCRYIYQSRCLGTWQFLVDLPFADLDTKTCSNLYYLLFSGFSICIVEQHNNDLFGELLDDNKNQNLLTQFNDVVVEIPADDLYYLLQTFCNIILSRNEQSDWDFIRVASIKLFEIGYTNSNTKEICYKIIRDLLGNVTAKFPGIISELLTVLKINIRSVDSNGIYLFHSLRLDIWQPNMDDFETLAEWLLNFNIESIENLTARLIISRLNWGFKPTMLNYDDDLFLSHEIHVRMACLIAQVNAKHTMEPIGSVGMATERIKKILNPYDGSKTTDAKFKNWCWNMVSRLRLHCMDLTIPFIQKILRQPTEMLKYIPELQQTEIIYQGVSESRPLALYLSILTTLYGHSVPEICHKGFIQMQLLLNDYRHSTVIRCLHLIIPLFIECPESLSKSDKFHSIMTTLLTADRALFPKFTDKPGPVVEMLADMIQAQLTDYVRYGITTPLPLIELWLRSLTTNSTNWYKSWNITYVIDLVLSIAYQFSDVWRWCKDFLRLNIMSFEEFKINSKGTTFNIFGSANQAFEILIPTEHSWLALIIFELEHEIYERENGIWPEFLRVLNNTNEKNACDVALKKSCSVVGCPQFPSSALVVYKLANFITAMPLDHAMLPIITQIFFTYYLERIPLTPEEVRFNVNNGVANKLFDGKLVLMKKLKQRLTEIINYYGKTSTEGDNMIAKQINQSCKEIFKTFTLWLEEPRLNQMTSEISELPPQYDSRHLELIFARCSDYWNEFIYLPVIRNRQKERGAQWLSNCDRSPPNHRSYLSIPSISRTSDDESLPEERIIKRLQSYDKPVSPPNVQRHKKLFEKFNSSNVTCNLNQIFTEMCKNFTVIRKYTNKFQFDYKEIQSLEISHKQLLQTMYKGCQLFVNQVQPCNNTPRCAQQHIQIEIRVPYMQWNRDEIVIKNLEFNRKRFDSLISNQTSIAANVSLAIVSIHYYINLLIDAYQVNQECNELIVVAKKIFYDLFVNYKLDDFEPAVDLCSEILLKLSNVIQKNQDVSLIKAMILRPDLKEFLLHSFDPKQIESTVFLEMYAYQFELFKRNSNLGTLLLIFEKNRLDVWLELQNPRLHEISHLLQIIINGLENLVPTENDERLFELRKYILHHMIIIFEHNFPEHYGEVLQIVLNSFSRQELRDSIFLALLNSLCDRADCERLLKNESLLKQKQKTIVFAGKQKLFSYKELIDTILLLTTHYQADRLQRGFNGLYPFYKHTCEEIAIFFVTFVNSAIVSLIYTYPGALADDLIEMIGPIICNLFSPWIVPYHANNLGTATSSNWIKHLTSANPILLPFTKPYIESYNIMINMFINTIKYLLTVIPAGTKILSFLFNWYEMNFAYKDISKDVFSIVHCYLMKLPWNSLEPTTENMENFNKIFHQFLPDCHIFIGNIFLNIDWTTWISRNINTWSYEKRHRMLSSLLMNTVKVSCEPSLRENANLIKFLEDSLKHPWYMLDYSAIESIMNWYVLSTEPSSVLQLPSEHLKVDNSILCLLQTACGFAIHTEENNMSSQNQAKRLLYIRTVVKLLRSCGSKYQKLLSTPDGVKAFRLSVIELLTIIEKISINLYRTENPETINLLIEIIDSLQVQGEFNSKLIVDAIVIWQNYATPGSTLLCCTLNALGMLKKFTFNICSLLESTLINYFRTSPEVPHIPSWTFVTNRIGPTLPDVNESLMIQNNLLMSLHLCAVYKLRTLQGVADKLTFLTNLGELLKNYKLAEVFESKMFMIWGMQIVCSCKTLETTLNAKSQLVALALQFEATASQTEGWSDSLLGAIGLNKDAISNRRRIMLRCFACIIYTLFPDESGPTPNQNRSKEYNKALEELHAILSIRKFNDMRPIALNAIEIIEHSDRNLKNFKKNVCNIIKLFYNDPFLVSLEEFWCF